MGSTIKIAFNLTICHERTFRTPPPPNRIPATKMRSLEIVLYLRKFSQMTTGLVYSVIRCYLKGEMQQISAHKKNINSKSKRSRTSMTSQMINKSTWRNYLYQS